jgi:signal transduction histidine kinase
MPGAATRARRSPEERQLALRPERLSPTDVVADVVAAEHAWFAAARVRLDLDALGEIPTVRVDAQRLGEALGNLLDNALRHTPPGGRVRVLVRAADTGAVIEVSDTGEGFDPADADRIFERFYRGEVARARNGAGSGVGLTIARAIVEAHGGTLTARSDGPGTGATFRLHLPTDRA